MVRKKKTIMNEAAKEQEEKFNPEKAMEQLLAGGMPVVDGVLLMRKCIIWLLDKEIKQQKNMQNIWESDARAMELMESQRRELKQEKTEEQTTDAIQ